MRRSWTREEQPRLAEEEAARTSEVFFQTGPTTANAAPAPDVSGLNLGAQPSTAQNSDLAFLNSPVDRHTVAPDRVMAPASPYVLQAGSVIPVVLINGIRYDLPGQITAQVTQHIYDSATGSMLLIPGAPASSVSTATTWGLR